VPAPDMRTPAQPLGGRAGGASRKNGQRATPSKQKTGQCVRNRLDRREEAPSTDDFAWTGPSEAPTGSRPCGVQEQ
jgi:hypothetical protein